MRPKHVDEVCKLGTGDACCAYLTVGGGGFYCVKLHDTFRPMIDKRLKAGTMNAKGDNCPGRPPEDPITDAPTADSTA